METLKKDLALELALFESFPLRFGLDSSLVQANLISQLETMEKLKKKVVSVRKRDLKFQMKQQEERASYATPEFNTEGVDGSFDQEQQEY